MTLAESLNNLFWTFLAQSYPSNPFQGIALPLNSLGPQPLLPGWEKPYGQSGGYNPKLYKPQPGEDRAVGNNQTNYWMMPGYTPNPAYGIDKMRIPQNDLMKWLQNILNGPDLRSI